MAIDQLKSALKAGELPGLLLFYGPEEYQKGYYREQVLKKVLAGKDEFSHMVLQGSGFTLDAFEDAVESIGFGSLGKLVEVSNLEFPKVKDAERKRFLALLASLPEYTTVLFYYDAMFLPKDDYKKYKALLDAAGKNGIASEFVEPDRASLAAWVKKQFAYHKKEISKEDVLFLLDYSEGTMAALKQETEKIALSVPGDTVTREDIRRITVKSQKAHIFDVSNAVVEQDYDRALRLIWELRCRKEEPISLASALSGAFCELYFTKACMDGGLVNAGEIAAQYGIAPNRQFLIRRYVGMAQRTQLPFLRRCVEECMEADMDLKGSKVDKWERIERMIGKMLLTSQKNIRRTR